MKNPLTTSGIEPATFRFVAQYLNHCTTVVPRLVWYNAWLCYTTLFCWKRYHGKQWPGCATPACLSTGWWYCIRRGRWSSVSHRFIHEVPSAMNVRFPDRGLEEANHALARTKTTLLTNGFFFCADLFWKILYVNKMRDLRNLQGKSSTSHSEHASTHMSRLWAPSGYLQGYGSLAQWERSACELMKTLEQNLISTALCPQSHYASQLGPRFSMISYVCMYVCMYVCTYVRMYVCTYVCMYVRTYVCMYVCIYVCRYVRMYVCTYVCTYVCKYARMYVRMYVCMYVVCTYVCMYVCMHECMHVVRMYVCMYVCMYVRTYVRTYVSMHACMYVCTCVCTYECM